MTDLKREPIAYEVVHGALCSCGKHRGRTYTRDGIHDRHSCPVEGLRTRPELDGFALRPIAWMNFFAPQPRAIVHLAIDWRDEMQWLREMLADADACDAWENEGGR